MTKFCRECGAELPEKPELPDGSREALNIVEALRVQFHSEKLTWVLLYRITEALLGTPCRWGTAFSTPPPAFRGSPRHDAWVKSYEVMPNEY